MTNGSSPGTALVTGGSAGIGEAICRQLLDAGFEVVSLSRRAASLQHDRLTSIEVDLADRDATREIARQLAKDFNVLNIIHNAGVIRPALVEEVKLEDLDYLTSLHLAAVLILTQASLPRMKEARYGRIVNISSRAALGLETRTAYSSTKAGMIGMTRTWALELAPFGITVNAVSPGPVKTDMFHEIIPENSPQEKSLADKVPIRRLGMPDDVARAVMFFLNPENSFVTGQNLFVCGGTSVASLSL